MRVYKKSDKQPEMMALLRHLQDAEEVRYMRYRFVDNRRTFIFDLLTGEFSHTPLPGSGAHKNLAPRNKGNADIYPCIAFYFVDENGNEKYACVGIHRIVASLGRQNRLLCKATKEAALRECGGRDLSEIKLGVNHANADKLNSGLWNLEWATSKENSNHIYRAKALPALDSLQRPNIIQCGYDSFLGGTLRTGIYMSAERNPEFFGDFLTNGCNGRSYRGEPYAQYMSRQLSEANLPAGVQTCVVRDEFGEPFFIKLAERTIWEVLGDCYSVRAVSVQYGR